MFDLQYPEKNDYENEENQKNEGDDYVMISKPEQKFLWNLQEMEVLNQNPNSKCSTPTISSIKKLKNVSPKEKRNTVSIERPLSAIIDHKLSQTVKKERTFRRESDKVKIKGLFQRIFEIFLVPYIIFYVLFLRFRKNFFGVPQNHENKTN